MKQQNQDMLRFITCGSIGGGKSTLISRLSLELQQVFDDQLATLKAQSRKYGTQGDVIDLALLVDGLNEESRQGFTIDVGYHFFASTRRKFIVTDIPDNEQYPRNLVAGASTADVALLLVDAKHGLLTQIRQRAFLVSLMGIRHVILVVNKMDLVDFDSAVFTPIKKTFECLAKPLGFETICAIPLSALNGDNITQQSAKTPWYRGPTLMEYLETIDIAPQLNETLVLPVQRGNHPGSNLRCCSGFVAQGRVQVGHDIRVSASGKTARVEEIATLDGALPEAGAGTLVTIKLENEIDVSHGDVLSLASNPLETTDQFEATLVWLTEESGHTGRIYQIKLATQWATASITTIKYRIDINTLAHEARKQLQLNDISVCNIATNKPLVFDRYAQSRRLGGFILVDRYSNATVATGMIRHSLRRSQNVHRQALSITRIEREQLNGHQGKVIWFTGLSGSGKSTIANALELKLHAQGKRTYILDGDNIRQGLNKDLGFTDADRVENIRRIAEVAKLMMDAGMIVITAFISPFKREREMARDLIGVEKFVEVFMDVPLELCEGRDPKGLYKKARNGQIPNMTGINSPYEAPEAPNFVFDRRASIEENVNALIATACI